MKTLKFCKYKVPGNKFCGKPFVDTYLGIDACQDCITRYTAMWQNVGELGIPIRHADPKKDIPEVIAKAVDKGKIKKYDREFLEGCNIEPLT